MLRPLSHGEFGQDALEGDFGRRPEAIVAVRGRLLRNR
jgi:hypothetical protein